MSDTLFRSVRDRGFSKVFLLIVFASVLAYEVQNLANSDYLVSRDESVRSSVYMLLGLVVLELVLFLLFTERNLRADAIHHAFVAITAWIVLVNLIRGAPLWAMATHAGLSIWWVATYVFFSRYLKQHPRALRVTRLFAAFMYLFFLGATIYSSMTISSIYDLEFAAANVVYFVLSIAPLVLLRSRPTARIVVFLSLISISLYSLKRGAIIAAIVMVIVFLLVEVLVSRKAVKGLLIAPLVALATLAAVRVADQLSGGVLAERFSSDEISSGSGRADLYNITAAEIGERGMFELLIGSGSGSSVTLLGTSVHNEWLEMTFLFGLVGAFLYLLCILAIGHKVWLLIRARSVDAPVASAAFVYVVVVGLYSSVYFVHSTFFILMFFGVLRGVSGSEVRGVPDVRANERTRV